MTSISIQCFRAIRAERRANDLTVEALIRGVLTSAISGLAHTIKAARDGYSAYDKRRQRRRHHYRRAMQTLSYDKAATTAVSAPQFVAVSNGSEPADAHVIHFAAHRGNRRDVRFVDQSECPASVPEAHVCSFASMRASRGVTTP